MNAPHSPFGALPPAIDAAARGRAHEIANARGVRLIEALEESCGLSADDFVRGLGASLAVQALDIAQLHALQPRFDLIAFAQAVQRECVLASSAEGTLILVVADPFRADLRAWAEEAVRQPFTRAIAHRADIAAYLHAHEGEVRAMDAVGALAQEARDVTGAVADLSLRSISSDTSPVVKLVNSTLYDAMKAGASDVHLEMGAAGMQIKYRIDGVLSAAGAAAGHEFAEQVISRIKVMAELDIAERRIPQDGRFKVAARGREIDVRVSIMPSIFGEDAVLRILDKQALADEVLGLRLGSLGFDEASVAAIRDLSAKPFGMLLATGPTGSGKTTTLYAALSEINSGLDKIITIEDPVEYQLPGVLQIPVNERKGLTFARGLRSILRHDPDKIMVGEIRDPETAQIAIQAALTGHLVFTTVHANNVFDVIGRFSHMDIDPHSFMSALNGIVAQRLMRVNCPHCAAPSEISGRERSALGLSGAAKLFAGRGCGQCRGSGYHGRKAICEILRMDDELRDMIARRESPKRVKDAARSRGFRSLRQAALGLVERGESSLEEMNRVTVAE
jgi:general secretion pathway protein E